METTGAKMSDTAYIISVLAIALLVIFGAAYFLDRRNRKRISESQSALGIVSRSLLWVSRGVLIITILALASSFIFYEIAYARLAWYSLFAYIALGITFQITRRNGM